MMLDASLAFVQFGAPLSLVAGAGVSIQSAIIDLMGAGVGQPVTNIVGNAAQPGQADAMGVGPDRPELAIALGDALVTANAATLEIDLQGAPNAAGNVPGAWQTFGGQSGITAALGIANRVVCRLPWLPPWPFNERPRFLRLNFVVPAATNFTAGTIAYALPTTARFDPFHLQAAKNYVIGPLS